MKQSFASNQFNQTSGSLLRAQYARVAAGARSHNALGEHARIGTHSALIPVNIYQNNMSEFAYMLRLLKSSSDNNKWITLIAPPANFSLSHFAQAGIDVSKIRVARPTAKHNASMLVEKALQSDTSAAVIAFGDLSQFTAFTAIERPALAPSVFVVCGIPDLLH